MPPPALKAFFGCDALVEEVVSLADKFEPIALVGAGGIGKTSVALSALHHDRIKRRFRDYRRFLRCDGFTASLANFLGQLSKVTGAGVENPEDLALLRPFLSSTKIFIILDNAETMLDPEGTDSQKILAAVEELCQFERICVCITSRITTVPQDCRHPTIPTLSMDAACDIFYRIYDIHGRSNSVEDLMRLLEFHPLSISVLAATASHNRWDYDRLTKEWNERRAEVLQTHSKSLAATIALSLESPTFLKLGPDAKDLLGIVAFFPRGVDENNLEWLFPDFLDIKFTFDKFCALSLTYRSGSRITMLAPIRDHLAPRDPTSSPLLCGTKDRYFTRLSVNLYPGRPGYDEARWIVSEDVNVEHLLDVFTSVGVATDDVWDACAHFLEHLLHYRRRKTALARKIEGLPDDHPFKSQCLFQLSELLGEVGNFIEQKELLTHVLELEGERMDRLRIARALKRLSHADRLLRLEGGGVQQAEGALEVFEEFGDTNERLDALNTLGVALCESNQPDAAEKVVFRAINLAPEQGQEYPLSESHYILGSIYGWKGQKEKAIHHYEIALSIASHFKWRDQLQCHFELARLFFYEDELDKANTHVGQAKLHAIDDAFGLGRAMELQARIWSRQYKLEGARLEASRALEIFEKLGARQDAERCRNLLELNEPVYQDSLVSFWKEHCAFNLLIRSFLARGTPSGHVKNASQGVRRGSEHITLC